MDDKLFTQWSEAVADQGEHPNEDYTTPDDIWQQEWRETYNFAG